MKELSSGGETSNRRDLFVERGKNEKAKGNRGRSISRKPNNRGQKKLKDINLKCFRCKKPDH